jgi:threonine aldolase
LMDFASDNASGLSEVVLAALAAASRGSAPAYGSDALTQRSERLLSELFGCETRSFLVTTGTAANALALAAVTPPWGAIFCHEDAHVTEDECGAPEMFSAGAKLVGLPGAQGKITVEGRAAELRRFVPGLVKQTQPAALSISQATECGTLYRAAEIAALGELVRARGMSLHMDGARFANALARLGGSAADITWKAGVDALSFGATKNGTLACEAVVFFDLGKAEDFAFRRKRAGQTLSKGRFLGAQMVAYLENGHWLARATHANAMAQRLSCGLAALPSVALAWPTEINEVFAVLPAAADRALKAQGVRYHEWQARCLPEPFAQGSDRVFVRLVTSFASQPDEIDRLIEIVGKAR